MLPTPIALGRACAPGLGTRLAAVVAIIAGVASGCVSIEVDGPAEVQVADSPAPTRVASAAPPPSVQAPPAALPTPPRPTPPAPPRVRALAGPIRGAALGLHAQDPAHDYGPRLAEIAELGADWVLLCFNFYQEKVDSVEVAIDDPRTQTWERITRAIRQAHDCGLRVALLPVILIRQPGEHDWRGTIAPTDRAHWYASYDRLLARIATLAEDEQVALLSVGSELNSMQTDRDEWVALIERTRERFSGALTYSVNWDSITAPGFYHALDYVGMTTYFSLTQSNEPTVAEMVERWRALREDLVAWQTHVGKPLIFTEVGFPSQDGANRDPWNYYISEQVDIAEQRDCFEAFTRVWIDEPALTGVFFYNWFEDGGESDRGYSPRGKPALEVIRRWFRPGGAPAPSSRSEEP
ncbi:MAG: hypothetical protein AB7O52_09520 [Planctomycetota bacterium]